MTCLALLLNAGKAWKATYKAFYNNHQAVPMELPVKDAHLIPLAQQGYEAGTRRARKHLLLELVMLQRQVQSPQGRHVRWVYRYTHTAS